MMLFKFGVKPAFEDKINKSEVRIDLGPIKNNDLMDKLWETIVFEFITGNCPCIASKQNAVTGVRLVQKQKNGSLMTFRLEIWLEADREDCDEVK